MNSGREFSLDDRPSIQLSAPSQQGLTSVNKLTSGGPWKEYE